MTTCSLFKKSFDKALAYNYMCGIIGSFQATNADLESLLKTGLSQLHHRGPDDSGLDRLDTPHGQLWLGHARLSIIDLSKDGHQPMYSKDGRYSMTFNGEIYNYKELREELVALGRSFETASDTEVLLVAWQQWKVDALPKLQGMFAIVIFDKVEQKLFFARDAFGIKPLYYHLHPSGISWSSEILPLRTVIDKQSSLNHYVALSYLLTGNYDYSNETFVEGISSLNPGHYFEYDLQSYTFSRHIQWNSFDISVNDSISYADAVEQTRELFLDSIRLHLRSDVPLGAALSGGIDSSSIVSAIRHVEPDLELNTFSYVARGYPYNEEKWVDIVNNHTGAIPHKFVFTEDDILKDMDEVMRFQGEPFASSSIYAIYRTYKEAKVNGVVVTLDGQGADELFAGYSGYPHATIPSFLKEKGLFSTLQFIKNWSAWPGRNKKTALSILVRELKESVGIHQKEEKLASWPWMDSSLIKKHGISKESYRQLLDGHGKNRSLAAQLKFASTQNGLPNLLRTGDRSSMRWTIESRVPFLHPELAKFVLSLPANYLVSKDGQSKHLFREAMRGIVPDPILDRKDKIGAKTPDREILLRLSQRDSFKSSLQSSKLVDGDMLMSEMSQNIQDPSTYNQRYWRVFNLFEWMSSQGIKE